MMVHGTHQDLFNSGSAAQESPKAGASASSASAASFDPDMDDNLENYIVNPGENRHLFP